MSAIILQFSASPRPADVGTMDGLDAAVRATVAAAWSAWHQPAESGNAAAAATEARAVAVLVRARTWSDLFVAVDVLEPLDCAAAWLDRALSAAHADGARRKGAEAMTRSAYLADALEAVDRATRHIRVHLGWADEPSGWAAMTVLVADEPPLAG